MPLLTKYTQLTPAPVSVAVVLIPEIYNESGAQGFYATFLAHINRVPPKHGSADCDPRHSFLWTNRV